ncbi:MAG: hypothetical protein AAGA88_14570, partial [Pseudomonadota bacterium]
GAEAFCATLDVGIATITIAANPKIADANSARDTVLPMISLNPRWYLAQLSYPMDRLCFLIALLGTPDSIRLGPP